MLINTLLISSSKASYTPILFLALVSMNIIPCFLAIDSPSYLVTALLPKSILFPTNIITTSLSGKYSTASLSQFYSILSKLSLLVTSYTILFYSSEFIIYLFTKYYSMTSSIIITCYCSVSLLSSYTNQNDINCKIIII